MNKREKFLKEIAEVINRNSFATRIVDGRFSKRAERNIT